MKVKQGEECELLDGADLTSDVVIPGRRTGFVNYCQIKK